MIKQDTSSEGGYNNPDLQKADILISGLSKSALRWVVASLSLILFIAIIALTYSIGMSDIDKGAIPIIRADGSPLKVRPENPEGKKYPHQDLSIYQNSNNFDLKSKVELVDSSEKPIEDPSILSQNIRQKSTHFTENTQQTDDIDNTDFVTVSDNDDKVFFKRPSFKDTEQTQIQLKKSKLAETEKTIQDIVQQKNTPQENQLAINNIAKKIKSIPEKKAVVPSGNIYLQIGAFRSESEALTAFNAVKSKHSVLSQSGHNIVKVDLGSKGIFYRLRVGPYASKQDSQSVCARLKAGGQPCL